MEKAKKLGACALSPRPCNAEGAEKEFLIERWALLHSFQFNHAILGFKRSAQKVIPTCGNRNTGESPSASGAIRSRLA